MTRDFAVGVVLGAIVTGTLALWLVAYVHLTRRLWPLLRYLRDDDQPLAADELRVVCPHCEMPFRIKEPDSE